jgi:MoaA/NifB/PqqE/SkfB family radical SAM enzyme
MNDSNKSFCVIPWINISSHTDGSSRLCCESDDFIKKNDGTNFNLGYDNLEDIINSDSYKKIRQDMVDGKPIEGCYKCYNAENNNGISSRQNINNKWENDPDFLQKYNKSLINENEIENTVQYFDLRFGNLCNLACRSCYAGASSQLNKEIKELQETQPAISKFHGIVDDSLNEWYKTDMFDKNIINQLPKLRAYYCVGGEPTLIDKNYEILKIMVDSGHSEHIGLTLSTNMTNTKKDFYAFFKYFKNVKVLSSIDGVNEMQEYLRYPSSWNHVSTNLIKVVDMQLPNVSVVLNPVIQKTNLGYITELFDFAEKINRKYEKAVVNITPIVLMDPAYLDLIYLPTDYKIKCWEKIEKWITNSCRYQWSTFHQKLEIIKTKCYTEVDYQANLLNYFEFSDIFDKNRNENLSDINPELNQLRTK